MRPIPREKIFDSTVPLLLDPYRYIARRCRAHATDLFATRLLLQPAICMTGSAAAALFYDNARFRRFGAPPGRLQKTLFGEGGVQGLDDEAHRHRKAMFLSLMSPESIDRLAELTAHEWQRGAERWTAMERVVLYDEFRTLLTRAVCAWAGVPLAEEEVGLRSRELGAMFDAAGGVGPRHWWSRLARQRGDRWIGAIVDQVRAGALTPPESSPLAVVAAHRTLEGELLNPHVAAVEVLNLIRPTVAVAVYLTFVAHALQFHPESRARLRSGDNAHGERFVQEVRRFYPFFPAVLARVRHDFTWDGYAFPAGRRVVLDLYGTNHDPRVWRTPDKFLPDRFTDRDENPYAFIPQGGGDHAVHHRCAGEWITIRLMKLALEFLTRHMRYHVPAQDLAIDYTRLPALPRSRFVIRNVRFG